VVALFNKLIAKHSDSLYFAFRVIIGVLFFMIGTTKLLGWFGGTPIPIPMGSLFWFAGLIEVIAGILITVGFLTRYAAAFCAVEMLIAYYIGHLSPAWNWNPITNMGFPALLYFAIFLAIVAKGPGKWAIDKK
jgi:putative oxidoreductase